MTAELIARLAPQLGALPRPDDGSGEQQVLCLPTFRAATLPEGMGGELAEQLGINNADINSAFLEALFHAIDLLGYEILPRSETSEMRAAALINEGKRNQVKHFHTTCGAPLFRAMIQDFDTDNPRINCAVIKALGSMSTDCKSGHKAN